MRKNEGLTLARSSNMHSVSPGMPTRSPPGDTIVVPTRSPSTKSNASTSNPAVRAAALHPAPIVSDNIPHPRVWSWPCRQA